MVLVVTSIDFVVIIVLCIWCNDKSLLQYYSELKLEGGGILQLLVVYFCSRAYFVITGVMMYTTIQCLTPKN